MGQRKQPRAGLFEAAGQGSLTMRLGQRYRLLMIATGLVIPFAGSCSGGDSKPDNADMGTDTWRAEDLGPVPTDTRDDAGRVEGAGDIHDSANLGPGPDGGPEDAVDVETRAGWSWVDDYLALTLGVQSIALGDSVPSPLAISGPTAFPVVQDDNQVTFVAAARVDGGRAVAFGHGTFFGGALQVGEDAGTLLLNAVAWAAGDALPPKIGLSEGMSLVGDFLVQQGYETSVVSTAGLAEVDVYLAWGTGELAEGEAQQVRDFLAGGGGVLVADIAWWWSYDHDNVPEDYPGNRLMWDAGITWTAGTYIAPGTYAVPEESPHELSWGRRALEALVAHAGGESILDAEELALASRVAGEAIEAVPLALADFFGLARELDDLVGPVVPSPAAPFDPLAKPARSVALVFEDRIARDLPAQELEAHPCAGDFPGEPTPGAQGVVLSFEVDGNYGGISKKYLYAGWWEPAWRSTGLYLPAGWTATVTLPAQAADAGIDVRIGCHTDSLWGHGPFTRFPRLSRVEKLEAGANTIGTALGGLLYVRIPAQTDVGSVEITVDGAIRAPRYIHGATDMGEWIDSIRHYPAPWAELESDRLVLSLPSTVVRELDDPDVVMDFWNTVMDGCADLAAIPHQRPRPMRFVMDRQISVGYMHSGYPLMAHLDAADFCLDVAGIYADGSWGMFHEIGHNHQYEDWLLPQTTESSVNLWSVYVHEEILGIPREEAHEQCSQEMMGDALGAYIDGGKPFADWTVWLALQTYLQLQVGFGWDGYKAVFGHYLELAPADVPTSDQEKFDTWMVLFAQQVDRDLGPFFTAWNLPVSQSALEAIADLPAWEEDPMN